MTHPNQGNGNCLITRDIFKQNHRTPASVGRMEDNHLTQACIKLKIPQNYHHGSVISHLISEHGITANVIASHRSDNPQDDRWFTLELRGKATQLRCALNYLDKLNLGTWQNLCTKKHKGC